MCIWETSSSQQVVLCVQFRTCESLESSSNVERAVLCVHEKSKNVTYREARFSQHLDYLMSSSRLMLFCCSLQYLLSCLFAIHTADERSISCVISNIEWEKILDTTALPTDDSNAISNAHEPDSHSINMQNDVKTSRECNSHKLQFTFFFPSLNDSVSYDLMLLW